MMKRQNHLTDGVGGVAFKDQVTTDLLSGLDTPSLKERLLVLATYLMDGM